MGVYIPDINIPECCAMCLRFNSAFNYCYEIKKHIQKPWERYAKCPLIEIANDAKSVRMTNREGFTRIFEERKTGHWIIYIDDLFPGDSAQECSVCHEWQFINGNDDNYCPNCGAKMEEENNEYTNKRKF